MKGGKWQSLPFPLIKAYELWVVARPIVSQK
jgi:hypothetical protein